MPEDLSLQPKTVDVSSTGVGTFQTVPPSFLERWGVVFLAWVGGWILVTATGLAVYALAHQPAAPNLNGLTSDQVKSALEDQKLLLDQWHESLNADHKDSGADRNASARLSFRPQQRRVVMPVPRRGTSR